MNAKANNTIDKVRELQRKLYLSAKVSKKRRYHALYDKIYREDILFKAWKQVKANKGIGGVDDIYINDVEVYGVDKFLNEVQQELINNTYKAKPVMRVYIDKKDGTKRPLGIPIIKDRVIQMATKIVIEPIFEADFKESSYGFRPQRNAHGAIDAIKHECNKGGWWVLDADIKGYFDNINHDKLMILVEQRISDKRMLKLIKRWLNCGIVETDGTINKSDIGTPQGGVISPLLSNIYLNYLDVYWDKHYQHIGKLIRYADDFVIISKTKKNIGHAFKAVKFIFNKLELELHPDKTKTVKMYGGEESFEFLGFVHRHEIRNTKNGKQYHSLKQAPTNKAMNNMRLKIKQIMANNSMLKYSIQDLIKVINRRLNGFKNYYSIGYSAKLKMKNIDWYVNKRFTIWYRKKKQMTNNTAYTPEVNKLLKQLKLIRLSY